MGLILCSLSLLPFGDSPFFNPPTGARTSHSSSMPRISTTTASAKPRMSSYTAKSRCWSANSSGVNTVASSYDSPYSSINSYSLSGVLKDELTLSALGSDVRATVADAATRPNGLSPDMMDSLIRLAEQTGTKLVDEAQACPRTRALMQQENVNLLSATRGIRLYESLPPPTDDDDDLPPVVPMRRKSSAAKKKVSFSRALWNRLTKRRRRPSTTKRRTSSVARAALHNANQGVRTTTQRPLATPEGHVPRVFGLTQVHVPLDELLDVIGHRSAHAPAMMQPAMSLSNGVHHSLMDLVDEHVCLRSMTLPSQSPSSEPRDFLFVEYHHAFKTPTGRRGYSIAYHSVHWTRGPSPARGMVRGSIYESGLVAVESETDADQVDLFCVAELNLKGDASAQENLDASRYRVGETLTRITQTIEERAKMLLSLDHTHMFHKARRAKANDHVCADCKGPIRQLPPKTEPFACRKCYIKVCEECSSIWQRGHKTMRLCMECWTDATLNRTCGRDTADSFMFL
jgi:hypothetical protein